MSSSFYLVPFQGQVTSRGTINLLLCELSDLDQRLSDLMDHIEETICIFENEARWAETEPAQNAEPQYGTVASSLSRISLDELVVIAMSYISVKVKNCKASRTHLKAHHLEREELEARYEPFCESYYAMPSRDDRARGTYSRRLQLLPQVNAKISKIILVSKGQHYNLCIDLQSN
ncbi:hypothetical protein MY1884_001703 [Beauveria asiatica]